MSKVVWNVTCFFKKIHAESKINLFLNFLNIFISNFCSCAKIMITIKNSLFRKKTFLIDGMLQHMLFNVFSPKFDAEFEYLTNFWITAMTSKWGQNYISLAFRAAKRGLKTNLRTLTVTIHGLYRACLGVPEPAQAPKSNIF